MGNMFVNPLGVQINELVQSQEVLGQGLQIYVAACQNGVIPFDEKVITAHMSHEYQCLEASIFHQEWLMISESHFKDSSKTTGV